MGVRRKSYQGKDDDFRIRDSGDERITDGVYHARISIIISPLAGLAALGLVFFDTHPAIRFVISLFGCAVLGLILSPDLDQDGLNTKAKTWWNKIPFVGWVMMYAYSFFWHLYGDWFAHRGISHWPLVGTLTRLIYFFVGVGLIYGLYASGWIGVAEAVAQYLDFWYTNREVIALLFLGVAVSDIGHWGRDYHNWQL